MFHSHAQGMLKLRARLGSLAVVSMKMDCHRAKIKASFRCSHLKRRVKKRKKKIGTKSFLLAV